MRQRCQNRTWNKKETEKHGGRKRWKKCVNTCQCVRLLLSPLSFTEISRGQPDERQGVVYCWWEVSLVKNNCQMVRGQKWETVGVAVGEWGVHVLNEWLQGTGGWGKYSAVQLRKGQRVLVFVWRLLGANGRKTRRKVWPALWKQRCSVELFLSQNKVLDLKLGYLQILILLLILQQCYL